MNTVYRENYDYLIESKLYDSLVNDGLMLSHVESKIDPPIPDKAYKIIEPEEIGFISYPYEWSFSQLKHAALTTLEIQMRALKHGMSLKDSSAYNVQFREGKPILIDTLSFEIYVDDCPWVAYRQFCQHFLAPLALMSYRDVRLNQLLRVYIDGIPLSLASKLLPFRTYLEFALLSHIHLHAKSQRYFADKPVEKKESAMSRRSLLALLGSLVSVVEKLKWSPEGTEWADYYAETNYSTEAVAHKKHIINTFVDEVRPKSVWDLGANVGALSRIVSGKGIPTIAFDVDHGAVEKNYLACVKDGEKNILPLLSDLTNPSPGIGWQNQERMSLIDRGPVDMVLALALVHHLAISNNLPFDKIARFFSTIAKSVVIEFVPKDDSQVNRMLTTREDIFNEYTQKSFEQNFGAYFAIREVVPIKDSTRIMYLMETRPK